ncbi:hybrid sensor histidine kinase/response regulator [Leptospira yasudae]|uniref:histidine kinase n=1 Tax=Leptospira yasudae TaxID=2202201 RepID=A0A6N4QZF1_9LEPT|nr:PAS domain-containing hybrid sensor histidine kinase/response regulator [Leptospira yasudae]TGL80296.1 PAS domain-containing hybrid sensor histidine kinase/response regulator [Leptospira yasudae]TGL82173.1 PAS domain-containing hybrid sensor histidine kinase/response regulator [Leptospira yasudae]TGL86995.1 PAS domain-containing hybrid sensor histidine kinase/response regulator [Leptospira yasudae]
MQDCLEKNYDETANESVWKESSTAELKEALERFRILAETIDEVFWMKEAASNRLLYVSSAYERIWKRSLKSLYENPDSWLEAVHPEDLPTLTKILDRKRDQTDFNERFRILHTDGSIKWIRIQSFRVFDANGKLDRIVGVARDVTQQHELERQLAHSQRMESIGSLAGGVAHDFNNILTVIMGFASLIEQNPNDVQKLRQSVQIIQNTAERGASLVKQLLTLARKTESHFKSIIFNNLILEAVNIARSTFPKSIRIHTDLQNEPIKIRADYTQIHQIFVNLILNAKDAMPTGGDLSIRLRETDSPPGPIRTKHSKNRKYAILEVSDTGIGMDETTKQKIFDPFFTTKGLGKGTGLGLSLVYGIVENHSGEIRVDSIPGKGSTFGVYLPIEDVTSFTPAPPKDFEKQNVRSRKTILLVEDEQMIREPLTNYLTKIGYEVLAAEDGEVALDLFAKHKNRIQTVICDLNLPKRNGLEVLKLIRSEDPSIPLILASGYMDPQCKEAIETLGLDRAIQKPYDFKTMSRILGELNADRKE